jgi:RNA polymerase sigma-70 factor, ECF subfamily
MPATPSLPAAPTGPTDSDLIVQVAAGNREALAELYERHFQKLTHLALRMLRNPRDAEDLLHDVFIEAWQRAATYDPTRSQVRTWLVMITRSRALDRIERAKTQLKTKNAEATIEPEGPSGVDALADMNRLLAWVSDLPQDQQEVLNLAYFLGLSSSEIAEELKIPTGTVKSRVAAALRNLRAKAFPPGMDPPHQEDQP